MNKRKLSREAKKHGDEAMRLLKKSIETHKAERQGLISESDAIVICVELNNQAADEMEKAIELQEEILSDD